MGKLSNILNMLQLLNSGKKYSIKELALYLEVSERMIRVYRDELEKAGIYVETIMGPYGGYILDKKYDFEKGPSKKVSKVIKNRFKRYEEEDRIKYNDISLAIKNKRKVEIIYVSSRVNKLVKRIIRPIDMYIYGGITYVYAYCELKRKKLNFRFPKILNYKILKDSFK